MPAISHGRTAPTLSLVAHSPARARLFDVVTLIAVIALFAVNFVTRQKLSAAVDADELLPVALIALRFGRRAGLAGAVVAITLTAAWELGHADGTVTLLGYVSRIGAFILVGLLLGTFVDQRRRAEAKLLRYFDASLDLLATVDTSGHFVRVNPAWETTLGYTPAELMARPYIEFVHPEDRQATLEQSTHLRQDRRDLVRFRNRYLTADGEVRWLEWNVHASTRDGFSHATARDITIQVAAEHQLKSNAQTLERMVAARTAELDEARAETLARLARAGEYRDDDTFQHTERVGATSAEVAAWLSLDGEQVSLIREAAPLHDIGKLAISDSILLKPGPLTDAERTEMQTHAEIGARLLGGSRSPVLNMAATIAASHHEHWDGGGYPARLSGESIPLWGRIVAVADVFDALTHDRPYKRAWTSYRAIEEIERQSGRHFDPRVVVAFLATRGVGAARTPKVVGARSAAGALNAA